MTGVTTREAYEFRYGNGLKGFSLSERWWPPAMFVVMGALVRTGASWRVSVIGMGAASSVNDARECVPVVACTSSVIVFHSPHSEHRPDQRINMAPQL